MAATRPEFVHSSPLLSGGCSSFLVENGSPGDSPMQVRQQAAARIRLSRSAYIEGRRSAPHRISFAAPKLRSRSGGQRPRNLRQSYMPPADRFPQHDRVAGRHLCSVPEAVPCPRCRCRPSAPPRIPSGFAWKNRLSSTQGQPFSGQRSRKVSCSVRASAGDKRYVALVHRPAR